MAEKTIAEVLKSPGCKLAVEKMQALKQMRQELKKAVGRPGRQHYFEKMEVIHTYLNSHQSLRKFGLTAELWLTMAEKHHD
jgi:hypothetical protein